MRPALARTDLAPEQVLSKVEEMPNVEKALALLVDIDHFLWGHKLAEVRLFRVWSTYFGYDPGLRY